ncbi:MAG TPA: hypothetical protein DCS12_08525 [Clostridiales bacterium]|nr:hypothetical protein [Clostridiales bacterium]
MNFNGYGSGSSGGILFATNGLKIRWNYGAWFTEGLSDYLSQSQLSNGVWYHVIFQRDGNNLKTYLNGSQLGSTTATTVSNIPTTGSIYLSRSPENNYFYKGALDEVIIENVAWSAEKIKKYYTASRGRFGII